MQKIDVMRIVTLRTQIISLMTCNETTLLIRRFARRFVDVCDCVNMNMNVYNMLCISIVIVCWFNMVIDLQRRFQIYMHSYFGFRVFHSVIKLMLLILLNHLTPVYSIYIIYLQNNAKFVAKVHFSFLR